MTVVGKRTKISVIIGAIWTVLNALLPDLLTPEVEGAITTIILFIAAYFYSDKKDREMNGGNEK